MRVVILGASVRAAAHSSRRAGLCPWGIDLFADRDLAALGPSIRADAGSYPAGLFRAASEAPAGPWFYTGALENHPDLIDDLASRRPLWGVSGDGLRAARDPLAWAAVLGRRGLPAPEARRSPDGLPTDGSWLVKPLASAGGRGVRPWTGRAAGGGGGVYYQRRVAGTTLAATFVGRAGGACLAGVTWQWVGRPGAAFGYRGSVGPVETGHALRSQIARIGEILSGEFGLRGLFGVDLVSDGRAAWPVEVNPRYTASVEVLEWATGRPLLAEHRAAFEPGAGTTRAGRGPGVVGKAIVYATSPCQAPELDVPRASGEDGPMPAIADVPGAGTRFRPGEPVLTLLSAGSSVGRCRAELERRLARWEARLSAPPWAAGEGAGWTTC